VNQHPNTDVYSQASSPDSHPSPVVVIAEGARRSTTSSSCAHKRERLRSEPGPLLGIAIDFFTRTLLKSLLILFKGRVLKHARGRVASRRHLTSYSDEKAAKRDIRIWHLVIENGY
jgi:hypothetical protein